MLSKHVSSLALLLLASAPRAARAQAPAAGAHPGVEAFNRALDDATRRMDNAATAALWEEDGVSLLPDTKPIIGKKAIVKFFDDVTGGLGGAHMEKFELTCHDVDVSGAWASEWCEEHQVVAMPDKPKFEGWGKMLFVLHRGVDGKWRIAREMWNSAAR